MSEEETQSTISITLKYPNDECQVVDGNLEESLGDFMLRHFENELSANKVVRFIINGQILNGDERTLQDCGLFDNCVLLCSIHQNDNDNDIEVSTSHGYYSAFMEHFQGLWADYLGFLLLLLCFWCGYRYLRTFSTEMLFKIMLRTMLDMLVPVVFLDRGLFD